MWGGTSCFWFRRQKQWHITWKLLGVARLPLQAQRCPSSQPCPHHWLMGQLVGWWRNLLPFVSYSHHQSKTFPSTPVLQPPSEPSLPSCPGPTAPIKAKPSLLPQSSSPADSRGSSCFEPLHHSCLSTSAHSTALSYASPCVHLNQSFLKAQEPEDGPSLLLGTGTNGITE